MSTARGLAERLTGFVETVGRLSSWCFIALAGVIIFDVVSRRFFVLGSTKLQELEWHIHTFLFCFFLAAGYTRDSHVRVDLLRERFSARTKAIIEFGGICLLLIPFIVITTYYGIAFAHTAFVEGEVSAAGTGLGARWIVKSFVPLGLLLLLVAAVARALLCLRVLSGGGQATREPDPAPLSTLATKAPDA